MDFSLSPEAREWQERARAFAQEWVKPAVANEWEPDPSARVAWDVIEAGSKAGFRTLGVPPEYGGPNPPLKPLTMALILEELATADPGIAIYFNHSMKDVRAVARNATKEQRDRFFADFTSDHRYLTAHASTEPEHGADRYLSPPEFRFKTTAVRDGDDWVINGRKHCIAAGNEARLVLVQANTDPSKPAAEGTTMFMVFRDTPGLKQGAVHDKAGLRLINNSEVIFEDCRVPHSQVLGTVNQAIPQRRGQFNDNGLYSMSMKLGIARAALENALDHAKNRVQGGTTIIDHQAVGLKLAEANAHVEVIRTLMYRYAWMVENQAESDKKFGELATWVGVESAFRAAVLALQVCGCKGAWLDYAAQKHVRDAMMYFPNDGTHTIHLLSAHEMLKGDGLTTL